MLRNSLLAAATGIPLVLAGQHANAVPISGYSTSTFTSLSNCDNSGSSQNCRIVNNGTQVQWGSQSDHHNFDNPSTLTPSSLPWTFSGNTDTTLTIAKLTWYNSDTLEQVGPLQFGVNWNLAVTFTSPAGSTGDSETFNLNVSNPVNPAADHITNLTLADLAGLSFSLPGVTVSNLQYHVIDGSGSGNTGLTCTAGKCDWKNDENNTAYLTITATFTADPTPVPEPASLALLGAGLIGAVTVRRRKQAA
jgi:hypothetical protein